MAFPALLIELMEKRGISGVELAKRLEVFPSWISQVRKGRRNVPSEAIAAWIRALRLDHEEAARFRLAVLLDQSPSEVKEHVRELEAKIDRLSRRSS